MVIVNCPMTGCTFSTADLPPEVVGPLLNIHALEHTGAPRISGSKGPKLDRPSIDLGVNEETWNNFMRRWNTFRLGSGIDDCSATTQFFQCASQSLGDIMLKFDPDLMSKKIDDIIKITESLAVIPIARGVTRIMFEKAHRKHRDQRHIDSTQTRRHRASTRTDGKQTPRKTESTQPTRQTRHSFNTRTDVHTVQRQ